MHTAICSFPDRASAERAIQRLADAGVARHDMHIEHRELAGELHTHGEGTVPRDQPAPNDAWDGLEREVAVDRKVLRSFGRFFDRLLGEDQTGPADTYSQHVERGSCVVVVDVADATQGERVSLLLHELQGADTQVVHRPEPHRPLRDIIGERQAAGLEQSFGTARSEMPTPTRGRQDSIEEDRAMAAARAGDKPGIKERDVEPDKTGVHFKNMGRSDGL
jgi:hypothetical protein